MRTITVCKATAMTHLKEDELESVALEISGAIPEQGSLKDCETFFRSEAESIREALRVLPQGTRYQLLLLMLEDAPILYRGR